MYKRQEIRSEFHSDRYIGFILTNKDKSGYEVQLYDKTGKQIINREITGEYSHVKIAGDEIIMFDGTKGCIISDTGIQRFKGDWGIEAQEVIPAAGIHRYLIAGEDELRLVYLDVYKRQHLHDELHQAVLRMQKCCMYHF